VTTCGIFKTRAHDAISCCCRLLPKRPEPRQAAIFAIKGQLIRGPHAQGGRDGTLYLPNILACLLDPNAPNAVMHVHMQALAANCHLIEACGLKPVIMLRSIPDMLASFVDMLDADPVARSEGLNCLIPEDFLAWGRTMKLDFVVRDSIRTDTRGAEP
jgi:hypothetical protein